ncbi:MAG: 16S rRNA (cytosine(1402)-N(4))-methyltransferase RsmH [Phycisphaerales bacterium]|nr:16S rRNA (cytosine(1402)-N(4))-methyltransferase RsmH [Phycisphaerales bacterium]
MGNDAHVPVLLEETLEALSPRVGETVVDCTAGRGGHAAAMASRVGPTGRVVLLDVDPANLAAASARVEAMGVPVVGIRDSFVRLGVRLRERDIVADVVLADLGFSSNQMDDPERGLSFRADGPLDMRLDPNGPVTAADLVRTLSERELAEIIFRYGEEPLSRPIARKLAETRKDQPILTTARLAELVTEAYGSRARSSRRHPATRTFMALRIAVNDELGALAALLEDLAAAATSSVGDWLGSSARIGIISFHSLEDRLVKRAFQALVARGQATAVTRKPVIASEAEAVANARARSAKFRAVQLGSRQDGAPGSFSPVGTDPSDPR